MQLTLERNLELAGRGDHRAFAAVFDLAAPRVLGSITRILVDRAEAEEVANEVFLEAWRNAARFDPARGSAFGWLFSIAYARAVDRVRATAAHCDTEVRDAAGGPATPTGSMHGQIERADDALGAREALATLSAEQREAVVLACFGGMTQTEIATRSGVPVGTVQTRLRDGMRQLRRALEVDLPPRDQDALSA